MFRVLMIAFQFPPFAGSSGVQRTLRFVQHLPSCGWQSIVLTAKPAAYESTSNDLMSTIPATAVVERTFALDAARHLAIGGRYLAFLARPDRWSSWSLTAVRAGVRMIERYRPTVIWSTYPIASAHVIASRLAHHSGLPWIADFRDPMAQESYPSDIKTREAFCRIEASALHQARFSVFTTPGAAAMYRNRYPDVDSSRVCVIENGYDEESFESASLDDAREPLNPGAVTFLHSGALYEWERDPTHLFAALGSMKQAGQISADRFRLRFRASGQDALLTALAARNGVSELIELNASIPYKEAIDEMSRADALLVLQSATCNQQIPAKLYEYLRSGRPVVALTDHEGDTATTMRAAGLQSIAPLDDSRAIAQLLADTLSAIESGTAKKPDVTMARRNSRAARAKELAAILEAAQRQ